jgi:hypothetical protein
MFVKFLAHENTLTKQTKLPFVITSLSSIYKLLNNQSTEGAEFVWVSECQKGERVRL